ncbi:tetratricopeptide repeat protein [Litoreibacter sp.]|nr:tetratricopeptide repeat protein [Litoreibacter sp.]
MTSSVACVHADEAELNKLFASLAEAEQENWESIERAIWREWSDSGSKSMDLLLRRGKKAMSDGRMSLAIDHFTALTDHAPDFAEGWNMRATAYFGAGLYSLSIADIQRTLALNPRHFGAMQGLGRMLEEMEDPQNALKAYRAALAIHPHRPGLKEAVERLEEQVSGQNL